MDIFKKETLNGDIQNGYHQNIKTFIDNPKQRETFRGNYLETMPLLETSKNSVESTGNGHSDTQHIHLDDKLSHTNTNFNIAMPRYKLSLRFANTGDICNYNNWFPQDDFDLLHRSKSNKDHIITKERQLDIDCEIQKIEPALDQPYYADEKVRNNREDKLYCELHTECELTHMCRKCEVAVCQFCRSSSEHKGHRTKRIKIAVEERKDELKKRYITEENEKHHKLRRHLHLADNEKAKVRSSCDEVVARIRQRCVYMKNVIETIANNLIKDVYYKKKECLLEFENTQKEIQNEIEISEGNLQHMTELYETQNERIFLREYKELKHKPVVEMKMPFLWTEYVSFENGGLSVKELKERFGTVSFLVATDGGAFTYENKNQHGRLSCKTKTSFKCGRRNSLESDDDEQDSGPINNIIKITDALWVNCGTSSKHLSLLNEDGTVVRTQQMKMKVEDFALTPGGDLVVSVYRDKVLKRVSINGHVRDILTLPYHPKAIAISKDGGYIVCMCDSYTTSVSDESRRIVVRYSHQGDEEMVYEYNGNTRLFTRPFRVVEHSNGDICVIDKTSMGSGQVVIIDQSGLVKSIYQGGRQRGSELTPKPVTRFAPSDIACDEKGRIFIVEADRHKIHLLNKDGCYIGHFLTSESDFFCPQSITIDKHNQIWLGNEYGEIKLFTCDWQ